jgi:integrase/recombinase XerD
MERGHRTLVITRKGGKVVTVPLAPRTARAIDLAIGERCEGPIFLAPDGRRLDRHGAARIVRRRTRRAGIAKPVGPHTLRHAFITAALDAGVPLRDVQEALPTPTREPPCAMTSLGNCIRRASRMRLSGG